MTTTNKIIIIICLALIGCDRQGPSPIIASVGKSNLTLEDLDRSIPAEYRQTISREQNINYVRQWIDNELLYQEALRQGLDKEVLIGNRLQRMKRDLLCAELLSRESSPVAKPAISEEAIRTYFEENIELFTYTSDVVKYRHITVDDRTLASQLRAEATALNFIEIATRYNPAPSALDTAYMAVERLPTTLAQALWSLEPGQLTPVIKGPSGYQIALLVDKEKKGATPDLEQVRNDIIQRLASQTQKLDIDKKLSTLRLKTNVAFYFDRIPYTSDPIDPK